MLIRGGKVYLPSGLTETDVLIRGSKIARTGKGLKGDRTINARGKVVIPGLIDVHVHCREPGATHKEDFRTASEAALAGGVTTFFDQPNTNPLPNNVKALKEKITLAKKNCLVNFHINAGFPERLEDVAGLRKISKFFGEIPLSETTGLSKSIGSSELLSFFTMLDELNGIATIHCENQEINDYFKKGLNKRSDAAVHCDARPGISEAEAVARTLALQGDGRIHLCHVSTAAGVDLVKHAKSHAKRISCEVTPHHIFLSREDMKRLGTRGKMNPPLRTPRDLLALWEGVHDGTVDMVATDHAPHTLGEKNKDIWSAPSGVPGLETMLPLLLNEVSKGKLSIHRIVELTSENPARIFSIVGKGLIVPGYDADITIVDLDEKWKVGGSDLHTKCGWSPWEGTTLTGRPVMTILGGKIAMKDGEVSRVKGECLNERLSKKASARGR